jgi:acyl dehydratase
MQNGPRDLYFDDVVLDAALISSTMPLERDDVIAFARQWDPLPVHVDDAAARAAGFDGLTASGTHLLAIKHRLLYDFGFEQTVIASFGFDEIRFRAPAYPGDLLHVRLRWIEKRLSTSRPGTGIAKHYSELTRGDGTVLVSLFDTILMRYRAPRQEE